MKYFLSDLNGRPASKLKVAGNTFVSYAGVCQPNEERETGNHGTNLKIVRSSNSRYCNRASMYGSYIDDIFEKSRNNNLQPVQLY